MAVKFSITSWTRFKNNLSADLKTSNIRDIKYLCKDYVPAGRAEKIVDALSLLEELENLDLFNEYDVSQLAEIFEQVNRKDLIRKVDEYAKTIKNQPNHHTVESKQPSERTFSFGKEGVRSTAEQCAKAATVPHNGVLLSPSYFREKKATQDETDLAGLIDDTSQMVLGPSNGRPSEYTLNHSPRGLCLIFSNKFKVPIPVGNSELKMRNGTEADIKNLEETFDWLGFKVQIYRDKTGVEMTRIMQSIAKEDHSNYDCFVCCISTHGFKGGVYGDDGGKLHIKDIEKIFIADQCPTLMNKPKLFFVQACQGEADTVGVKLEVDSPLPVRTNAATAIEPNSSKEKSKYSDFLFFMATCPGTVSWRHVDYGSWFIETLTEVFKDHAMDWNLAEMATHVNNLISKREQKLPGANEDGVAKQMSEIRNNLTSVLYFKPKQRFCISELPMSEQKQPTESLCDEQV